MCSILQSAVGILIFTNVLASQVLDIKDYKDYTFNSLDNCRNVQINISTPTTGLIHSPIENDPDSNKSQLCSWHFNAPSDYRFEFTFVNYKHQTKCTDSNKLGQLRLESNSQLWMKLHDHEGLNSTLFNFSNNQLDTCHFNLRSFTKLETYTDQVTLTYAHSISVQFLVMFRARKISDEENLYDDAGTCDEIERCNTVYDLDGTSVHTSCIPKRLLCRCDSGCNDYVKNDLAHERCEYYSIMNEFCESGEMFFRPGIKLMIHNQIRGKSFQQPDDMSCSSLVFSNEYGWISSPSFHSVKSYPSGVDCFYTVSLQPNQKAQLRFKNFQLNTRIVDLIENWANDMDTDDGNETMVDFKSLESLFKSADVKTSLLFQEDNLKSQPKNLGVTFDYDYLNIHDGRSSDAPLIAHFTSAFNNFQQNFNGRVFNSQSNYLFIRFHSAKSPSLKAETPSLSVPHLGFNLTYQVKGFCIEDQKSCHSLYELNCYSPNQTCNDVWDCHNGADERGCGPCKPKEFRCQNDIFCYRFEDRCDGDHQCIDKSDELNCNAWFCNSNNGTFLCDNGQCVYEQWVCDGTNDCIDGSDERNCPTPFTRRVITTAVLGGTLCSLLLVMALGCACKLYTLHTVGYRNNIRLSQTVQSAAAAAAAAPLLATTHSQIPTVASMPSNHATATQRESGPNDQNNANSFFNNNFGNIFRRGFLNPTNTSANTPESDTNTTSTPGPGSGPSTTSSTTNNNNPAAPGYQFNFGDNSQTIAASTNTAAGSSIATANGVNTAAATAAQSGDLPLPHHLIAPPTYNQTMGLVDEYEQRQLAFIEHVRSILQQQSTNGNSSGFNLININGSGQNSLSALTLIPTVTSSSTTVHRVTNSNRRSHSGRHHRHHYHHRSSSSAVDSQNSGAGASAPNGDSLSGVVSGGTGTSGSSSRSHNRLHRHNRHSNHSHANRSQPGQNIHHHITNNLTQVNFDANRRGLIIQQPETSSSPNPPSTTTVPPQSGQSSSTTTSDSHQPITGTEITDTTNQAVTATTSSNITSTLTAMSNKTTSVNLRDKIAKLIKDIVVHHGDNIQYVQLADQINGHNVNRDNVSFAGLQASVNESESAETRSGNDMNNNSSLHQETFLDNDSQDQNGDPSPSTDSNTGPSNASEDDVPLIQ